MPTLWSIGSYFMPPLWSIWLNVMYSLVRVHNTLPACTDEIIFSDFCSPERHVFVIENKKWIIRNSHKKLRN